MMNVKQILAGSLASLVLGACASAPPPPPPKVEAPKVEAPKELRPADVLAAGNDAFKKGDLAGAVAKYDEVLAKEPDNASAKFNRAVALHRMGKLEEAKAAYEAVLAASPEDTQAALNLGAVHKTLGKNGEAIKLYEKALKADEFNPSLLNNLSVLYRAEKKHDKAIEALRKLLKRDQNNIDAYKNLALVYFDQKKLKLAHTISDNALKLAERQGKMDPDIYVNLGMIYLATKENGKAMAAFKKAVSLDANNVVANYNIGSLALEHRDYELASRSYQVVAKAWPQDPAVAASLGYALQGLQMFEESAQWLEKAKALQLQGIALAAHDAEQVPLQLISVHQNAGSIDRAIAVAEEYMQAKAMTCPPNKYDGFCGRYNGLLITRKMEQEAKAAPPPSEEKKKEAKSDSNIFKDGPVDTGGEDAAPPAEEAPAGGGAE